MYDYLLVIGPGRSGSEFLYRALKDHPDFAFPEIKEGVYYRSPRAFKKARQQLHGKQLLCDIANYAYCDPGLSPGVERLRKGGVRILLMVLMRDHLDRAISMMRFRKSRGELSALFGARHLEVVTVRDRLTPKTLMDIFRLDVDILTVDFSTLVKDTVAVLDILACLCRASQFNFAPSGAVNASVSPRFIWLSAFGHLCATALRKFGFKRLLQRIKDSERVEQVFFVSLPEDGDKLCLSEESLKTLQASSLECRSLVEWTSERLGEGIYFRKSGSSG